ncbi:MAG: hypothetical protein A2156_08555 [Deltaproteobacteria bacterium RBG_16_48_10]|nr:MAG: hypothetical protein A2156_08555 [Deltaproteobacteria bacterium RBG_16_48_10]
MVFLALKFPNKWGRWHIEWDKKSLRRALGHCIMQSFGHFNEEDRRWSIRIMEGKNGVTWGDPKIRN